DGFLNDQSPDLRPGAAALDKVPFSREATESLGAFERVPVSDERRPAGHGALSDQSPLAGQSGTGLPFAAARRNNVCPPTKTMGAAHRAAVMPRCRLVL